MKGKIAVLAAVALLSQGCARTETVTTTDPKTQITTTVTKEHGFWESENYVAAMAVESKRLDNHKAVALDLVYGISEQVRSAHEHATTPCEHVLIDMNAALLIDRIPTSPGPSGIKYPDTATDMWGRNIVPLVQTGANIGFGVWDRFFSRGNSSWSNTDRSPSLAITNSPGANILWESDGNMNPAYNLSNGEGSMTLDFSQSPGYTPTTNTDRHDSYDNHSTQDGDRKIGLLSQ